MEKRISSFYGILIIFLFSLVCFLTDFIIIDKRLSRERRIADSPIVDEDVDSYKRPKNIKIDYNRDYVYDAGYHNDNKYKEYDYCDGETTYTHDGFDFVVCDKGSMRLSNLVVPYINIKSNDAYRVNRELKDLYESYASRFDEFYIGLEEGNISGSEVLNYFSSVSDDVLSVVIVYGFQKTDILYPSYKVYNFDLNTGDLVDYDELIGLLDVDTDLIYSNVKDNIASLSFSIFYDDTVNEFLYSIDNGSVLCFVNDGVLEYVLNVYVPGGRGNFYYRISSEKVINSKDN